MSAIFAGFCEMYRNVNNLFAKIVRYFAGMRLKLNPGKILKHCALVVKIGIDIADILRLWVFSSFPRDVLQPYSEKTKMLGRRMNNRKYFKANSRKLVMCFACLVKGKWRVQISILLPSAKSKWKCTCLHLKLCSESPWGAAPRAPPGRTAARRRAAGPARAGRRARAPRGSPGTSRSALEPLSKGFYSCQMAVAKLAKLTRLAKVLQNVCNISHLQNF